MVSSILMAAAGLVAYFVYSYVAGLRKHIETAKKIGLPYIVAPVPVYNTFWQIFQPVLAPLIRKLPSTWWEGWVKQVAAWTKFQTALTLNRYSKLDWTWELLYDGFKEHGDILVIVYPDGPTIFLANAEAIHQITARREAFPKTLESYQILNIFGRNILSTEGAEWKEHRKVTAPGFNEKNNLLVFAEATKQTRGMIRKWMDAGDISHEDIPTDTMRLTLHIITKIGFGVSLLWPGEKPTGKQSVRDAELSSNDPPEGHTMSFEHSLSELLEYLILVLLSPKWLLKILPFKATKVAYEAYSNWKQYMNEMFVQKIEEAREGKVTEGMDIMGSLVRSSYGDPAKEKKRTSGEAEKNVVKRGVLSDSDILGNAFVMILAGHETTANSIHFSLIELAINPKSQRAIQKEVQSIFGNKPSEEWDYESNINKLLGGMVGAVLNEQLRLMPPVIAIPKHVTKSSDQTIMLDGKKITLSAGVRIAIATPGLQRNPRYWPTQPSTVTDRGDDLEDFKPERWLTSTNNGTDTGSDHDNDDEFEGFTGQNTHAQLFRPVRGSFVPFSEGPRSCLGRRLAQVKVMAVLAVIFQTCSIELAVDQWATDDEVARMTQEEKRALYCKAQKAARDTIRTATPRITLKLHPPGPTFIPVRVVMKGDERFVNFVD